MNKKRFVQSEYDFTKGRLSKPLLDHHEYKIFQSPQHQVVPKDPTVVHLYASCQPIIEIPIEQHYQHIIERAHSVKLPQVDIYQKALSKQQRFFCLLFVTFLFQIPS